MAHKIKDIKWDGMPRNAFQFMLENDTYFFMWIMPDSSLRYYDYQEGTWNTIWEDEADYQSIIKDRKVYLVSKHYPKPENKKEETKSEWPGPEDGFPPVGTECEYTKPDGYKDRDRVWFWCYVVAHDQGGVVIRTEKNHYHLRKMPEYIFRPIKSDREKWVDLVQTFYNANLKQCAPCQSALGDLYDALQSGELPMPNKKEQNQ